MMCDRIHRHLHNAYTISARDYGPDRLPLTRNDFANVKDLIFGLMTMGLIGLIRQVLMFFVVDWVYRGIEHWYMRVTRAPSPLLRLARWDSLPSLLVMERRM